MYTGQGQSAYTPPPRVRLDVLSQAWQLFSQQMGTWVLSILVATIPAAIVMTIYYVFVFALAFSGGGRNGDNIGQQILIQLSSFFVSAIVAGMQYFFLAGLTKMALKQIRGQQIAINDIFSPRAGLPAALVAGLLCALGITFGSYLCIVPGLLLAGLWMFVAPILADQQVDGIEAMRKSFNLLKPDMWNALGVYFVLSLVAGLGGLACGVGALFTYPLLPLSLALLYRDFFPDEATPETSSPTPPTVLGGER